jgi:alpha-galactosidase
MQQSSLVVMRTFIGALALGAAVAAASAGLDAARQAQELEMLRGATAPPNAIWIDSLDLSKMVQRRQTPRAGRSLAGGRGRGAASGPPGSPITLGGVTYEHGIGTLSINELIIDLKGQATRFLAIVGLNDNASRQGSVTVEVWLDNKKVLISDVLRVGSPPVKVDVDLTGARFLELLIDDGNDVSTGDNADWAGGLIFLKQGATEKPESWTFRSEPAPPIASGWPATPRINPPRITGGTPGRPFIFRIPATGEAPLTFSARNLPAGLTLNPSTGVITGAIAGEGRTEVEVTVTNARGTATRTLTIVGGRDALALTPPLGTHGTCGGDRWTTRRCARLPTRWSRAAWPRTAISSSASTMAGRGGATPTACCSRTRSSPT